MKRSHILTIMICSLLLSLPLSAQTGRERASDTSGSYSFVKPEGWEGLSEATGFTFVDKAKTVVIEIRRHNYPDFKAFFADANLERDGLELLAQPQEIRGGRYFRTVRRSAATTVFDAFVTFSPHGGGVVVVGISDDKNADTSFKSALAVSDSIEFTKPKISAVAEQVKTVLSGKLLTYLYTGNGYSERMDIILCRSGQAYRSTDMGGFSANDVDGPSFSAMSRKAGTWRIGPDGSVLVVTMNSGTTFEYRLAARQASNEISLNGKRYFVQSQNVCR